MDLRFPVVTLRVSWMKENRVGDLKKVGSRISTVPRSRSFDPENFSSETSYWQLKLRG